MKNKIKLLILNIKIYYYIILLYFKYDMKRNKEKTYDLKVYPSFKDAIIKNIE